MIDEKQIREWAEHLCVVPRPPRYIGTCNDYEVKPHTDRRELAQDWLRQDEEIAVLYKENTELRERAEQAERERDELAVWKVEAQKMGDTALAHWAITVTEVEQQRDAARDLAMKRGEIQVRLQGNVNALAAAYGKLVCDLERSGGRVADTAMDASVLDANAPGWRE